MHYQSRGLTNYWKLEYSARANATKDKQREALQTVGCRPAQSLKQKELFARVASKEQGLLYYDDCTLSELETFSRDRGLQTSPLLSQMKDSQKHRFLATGLIVADRLWTFSRLFELPPELRKLIYEFYVCDLGIVGTHTGTGFRPSRKHSLDTPVQPPLAQVSRQLRQEVLPVFYCECRIHITFGGMTCGRHRIQLDRHSRSLVTQLHLSDHLALLRKLEISFRHWRYRDGHVTARIFIDLTGRKKKVEFLSDDGSQSYRGDMPHDLEEGVNKVVAKIHDREGRKLKLEDIYGVRRAIEAWLIEEGLS
jgi:hypothetical protein